MSGHGRRLRRREASSASRQKAQPLPARPRLCSECVRWIATADTRVSKCRHLAEQSTRGVRTVQDVKVSACAGAGPASASLSLTSDSDSSVLLGVAGATALLADCDAFGWLGQGSLVGVAHDVLVLVDRGTVLTLSS